LIEGFGTERTRKGWVGLGNVEGCAVAWRRLLFSIFAHSLSSHFQLRAHHHYSYIHTRSSEMDLSRHMSHPVLSFPSLLLRLWNLSFCVDISQCSLFMGGWIGYLDICTTDGRISCSKTFTRYRLRRCCIGGCLLLLCLPCDCFPVVQGELKVTRVLARSSGLLGIFLASQAEIWFCAS